MARRVLKFLHNCRQQSCSPVQLAQESLSNRKRCNFFLTSSSCYSTSSPRQINKKVSTGEDPDLHNDKKQTTGEAKHILLENKGYLPIYKFKYAPVFAALNKVKWQQLYLTSVATPITLVCSSVGVLPTAIPIAILSIGGVITSTLWIFGFIFKRVVGAILSSPDGKTICISIVDNKGLRQDDVFPTKDLVPLSDLPLQKFTSAWWILLHRYPDHEKDDESHHEPYKLFIQKYYVPDKKKFMEVFGSLLE